jgi:hypothetical protein
MPLALTNALWEVAYAYHAEAEEDLTDSGRVVSKPEVIQMAPRGSVTISRLMRSDRDCARLTGKPKSTAVNRRGC